MKTFKGGNNNDAENLYAVRGELTVMQSLIIAYTGKTYKRRYLK